MTSQKHVMEECRVVHLVKPFTITSEKGDWYSTAVPTTTRDNSEYTYDPMDLC